MQLGVDCFLVFVHTLQVFKFHPGFVEVKKILEFNIDLNMLEMNTIDKRYTRNLRNIKQPNLNISTKHLN